MRYVHDHQRSWPEILDFLTAREAEACYVFARIRGIDLEQAEPDEVEAMFAKWRVAGSPAPNGNH